MELTCWVAGNHYRLLSREIILQNQNSKEISRQQQMKWTERHTSVSRLTWHFSGCPLQSSEKLFFFIFKIDINAQVHLIGLGWSLDIVIF